MRLEKEVTMARVRGSGGWERQPPALREGLKHQRGWRQFPGTSLRTRDERTGQTKKREGRDSGRWWHRGWAGLRLLSNEENHTLT